MTTQSKILIGGSQITETSTYQVKKSLGDINSSSNFAFRIDNDNGENGSRFIVGDEVEIYADLDAAPTTKIFTGLVENIKYSGKSQDEVITLTGRDFSARLMDRTVEPEVYNNLFAGSIVKDIIAKYTDDITTTNVSDGDTITRIVFNQTPVFDAINQLAELTDFTFHVDETKDLHFKDKSTSSSGKTFSSGNIIKTDFKEQRDTVFNQIWVYGDRYLDGYEESFTGDGAGSEFTLLYGPHNTSITVDGAVVQPGAVAGMTEVIGSNIKYLVNFEDKKIIFTSGTIQGANVPGNGSAIIVDYYRDLPVIKVGDNQASIVKYGTRVKVIQDKSIKDPATAELIMLKELDEFSDPLKQGNLQLRGVDNLTPGETCIVDVPFHNISNQTYDMLEVQYDFNKQNELNDNVMRVKVNKKLPDITDTLKDILLQLKRLQSADIATTDLVTRYQSTIGSLGIRQSGLTVYTSTLTQSGLHGFWDGGNTTVTGTLASGTLQKGLYGEPTGSPTTDFTISWSGGYF